MPVRLAETDEAMLKSLSVRTYFQYILMTAAGMGIKDRVSARD
jgi:hypothetical protein